MGPNVISWFRTSSNYGYLPTINHSHCSHKPTERYRTGARYCMGLSMAFYGFPIFSHILRYFPICFIDFPRNLPNRFPRFRHQRLQLDRNAAKDGLIYSQQISSMSPETDWTKDPRGIGVGEWPLVKCFFLGCLIG